MRKAKYEKILRTTHLKEETKTSGPMKRKMI